MNYS
jgi:hypothetical protein